MSLNKVMLIGNVGADPEIRYLNDSQIKFARVRLATTERFTDRNGEVRENTEWHTVNCWRKLADLADNFIKKGTMIYVEGRLQTREWTDNSTGARKFATEITADNIQLLSKRENTNNGGYAQQGGSYAQSAAYGQPTGVSGLPVQNGSDRQFNQDRNISPAGPGGYQAPYQPNTPAAAGSPIEAPKNDFSGEGDDDLPF